MKDPTYIKDEIIQDPEWELAFTLSEMQNNNAPIGWSEYLPLARALLSIYKMERRNP